MDIEELRLASRSGIVRLPELVGVPFTSRVKAVVDHPHFQRLRRVKQLSLTYLVFPGATHTRFEHSLGVFENTTRYIISLLTDPRDDYLRTHATRSELESLLLAALLHDIGHYPFAHLMEDLYGEIADHEELILPILNGEAVKRFASLGEDGTDVSLAEVIKQHWDIDSLDDICHFTQGLTSCGQTYSTEEKKHKDLLRSVLCGPVDSDKMDYLYRDSIHCGVPYGRFIDRDRFFQALTVDNTRYDRIALTEKGRIGVELFAYARSAMFSEVYWHHSARAITAMLNRAIYEAAGSGGPTRNEILSHVFALSDENAVEWLYKEGSGAARHLLGLLRSRRLYKRLLVLESIHRPELYRKLDRIKWEKPLDFQRFSADFAAHVIDAGLLPDPSSRKIINSDILIDIPLRKKGLDSPPVIPEHAETYYSGDERSMVLEGISSDFERWVRKIRIFIHPDIQQAIAEASGSKIPDAALRARLLDLLEECATHEIETAAGDLTTNN